MDALTLVELKRLCTQRGLAVGGNKCELIERLTLSSKARSSGGNSKLNASESVQETMFPIDYTAIALPQLKDLCRKRALPVGGIKDDIVARLKASDPRNMTLVQLKERCREAGLPVTGTKPDLAERVVNAFDSNGISSEKKAEKTSTVTVKQPHQLQQKPQLKPPTSTAFVSRLKKTLAQPVNATTSTSRISGPRIHGPPSQEPMKLKRKSEDARSSYVGAVKVPKTIASASVGSRSSQHKTAKKPDSGSSQKLPSATLPRSMAALPKQESVARGTTEWFLVYSKNARFPYEGPDFQFFPLFRTKEDAIAAVKHVYYKQNPWGWTQDDFDDSRYSGKATSSKKKDGLLTLSMHEEEEWTVKAICIPPSFQVPAQADPGSAIVIYSLFGYLPDGFHSGDEQEFAIQAVVTSPQAATARVKEIFNEKHSYEWSIAELTAPRGGWDTSGAEVVRETERGLLTMSIHPDDDEAWSVHAQAVRAIGEDNANADYDSTGSEDDHFSAGSDHDYHFGYARPY